MSHVEFSASALSDVRPARICVAGAGAIGGTLAARLSRAGHDVSVIARGDTLAAIRSKGLRLIDAVAAPDTPVRAEVRASDRAEFGVQDVVIIAVKAHGLPALLPQLTPLIGADTLVLPAVNGLPWWYFQAEGGPFDGEPVRAVDPDGALLVALPWRHIVGCAVYIAAHVAEPGLVVTTNANRLVLGAPDHRPSAHVAVLCRHLAAAGIKAEASERIREAIWVKLMANVATNPLSVVTEGTLDRLHSDAGTRRIIETVMGETLAIAAACGVHPRVDIDSLIETGRRMAGFKTSMLQDFEKGQPLELAAIGDAVVELAMRYDVPIPATRQLLALARFRALRARTDTTVV